MINLKCRKCEEVKKYEDFSEGGFYYNVCNDCIKRLGKMYEDEYTFNKRVKEWSNKIREEKWTNK